MSANFRDAVFKLCKKLSTNSHAKEVRDLIHSLSLTTENCEKVSVVIKRPPHGDLAYIGSHQGIQFLGFLFADESVEEINKRGPFNATSLDDDERLIIERAHNTVSLFLNSCISKITEKYAKAAILINPYSQYRSPNLRCDAGSFLSDDDIEECVEAFQGGKIYKKIITNEALRLFDKIEPSIIHRLVSVQNKQFNDDLDSITNETEEYFHRLYNGSEPRPADVLMLYTIYCYALRKSLGLAVQMLYEAIMGHDMPVMNNDNIIELTDHQNSIVYEKYIILTQEVMLGFSGSSVGSIALLSCDPSDTYHIKQFGQVIAMTINLVSEFGSSSKVTMITVDEELNPIHRFTEAIMQTNLGQTSVVFHDA